MARFIVRRLVGMVVVMFVVSVVTFVIFFEIPGGDPAVRLAGRNATAANIAHIRHTFGLDSPVYVQYARMVSQAFSGKLISYVNYASVRKSIIDGLPATVSLTVGAAVIWIALALLIGTIAARRAGQLPDLVLTSTAMVGLSLPAFWVGIELRYWLAERSSIFPDGQYVSFGHSPWQWLAHLALPCFVLALTFAGVYGRVLRSNILDAMADDHVITARAKGLSERAVFIRHVLRNSLIPLVSLFGLDFAALVGGGTILIEDVFDLNGVGQYAAQAIGNLDLPAIMGVTLYSTVVIVVMSAIVDIVYAKLDPRIEVA
jgi:peptide/nickel transport system permease protein